MRRIIVAATAAVTVLAGAVLLPASATAMPLSAQAGIAAAAESNGLVQDVAYVCRRVWRCGPYGCGWRRSCYYTRPHYYGRPYRYYRRHYYYHRW